MVTQTYRSLSIGRKKTSSARNYAYPSQPSPEKRKTAKVGPMAVTGERGGVKRHFLRFRRKQKRGSRKGWSRWPVGHSLSPEMSRARKAVFSADQLNFRFIPPQYLRETDRSKWTGVRTEQPYASDVSVPHCFAAKNVPSRSQWRMGQMRARGRRKRAQLGPRPGLNRV
jgi:hypothetical protein